MKTRSVTRIRIGDHGDLFVDSSTSVLTQLFGSSLLGVKNFRDSTFPHVQEKSVDELINTLKKVYTHYKACSLCIRNCRVDRTEGQKGWCGAEIKGRIYCAQTSYSEESVISPCYEIYFAGCNMACHDCHQQGRHDNTPTDACLSASDVVNDIVSRRSEIKSIAFLGGNPDQSIFSVLVIVKHLVKKGVDLPMVWNSNATWNPQLSPDLNKFMDLFIPDFKYGNDECALKCADIDEYVGTVKNNIGRIKSENQVIIRHRPLLGHLECCSKPIINWISELHNSNRYFLSLLPSFYDDNSDDLEKCVEYAASKKVSLIF